MARKSVIICDMKYVGLCSSRKIAYVLFCEDNKCMSYESLYRQWYVMNTFIWFFLSMTK